MRYVEFRDSIKNELRRNRSGYTWKELKVLLDLPYRRPCPMWISKMEDEIGLRRVKGSGRALIWTLVKNKKR